MGSRSTARLMIWPPIVRPIWVSSPAAWTAVVTSSTPLGRPCSDEGCSPDEAGSGARRSWCRSRARPRAPRAGEAGCGVRAAARRARARRPRRRRARRPRRRRSRGAAGLRAAELRGGGGLGGGGLRRRSSRRRSWRRGLRRWAGLAAGGLAARPWRPALGGRSSRGLASRSGFAACPELGAEPRRRGGRRALRRARAAGADPLRAGRRERGEHPLVFLLGLRLRFLGLLDLVSHAPASVRFSVRTRRTPAEL